MVVMQWRSMEGSPHSIPPRARVGDGCAIGRSRVFGSRCGECSVGELDEQGRLDWKGVFADGSSGNSTYLATLHGVTLIELTLDCVAVPRRGAGRPRKNRRRLIDDKATDSDRLRSRLRKRDIELICPHKSNRHKAAAQDDRKLRRYKWRWNDLPPRVTPVPMLPSALALPGLAGGGA